MKDINDVLFIVEARLHSSRMHQKMIKPFADTTLLDLLLSKLITFKFDIILILIIIFFFKLNIYYI